MSLNPKQHYFKERAGINLSTAHYRLTRLIIFGLLRKLEEDKCCICDEPLDEDFTFEHIEPWMYSEDPLALFMDAGNVSFAHHACNSGRTRSNTPGQKEKFDRQRKYGKTHKLCPTCDTHKEFSEFNKNSAKPSGLDYQCRACRKARLQPQ